MPAVQHASTFPKQGHPVVPLGQRPQASQVQLDRSWTHVGKLSTVLIHGALTDEIIGPTLDPRGDPAPPRGNREFGLRGIRRR